MARLTGKVAIVTLNRPKRKNSLTFEGYRELIRELGLRR